MGWAKLYISARKTDLPFYIRLAAGRAGHKFIYAGRAAGGQKFI
jgi:hypothetical protein